MATLTAERAAVQLAPNLAARAGMAIWRLFTSVNFAVLQIIVLGLLAVVGMTIRQLPGFAFRSAGDYATEMAKLRAIYEPVLGSAVVSVMERLQLFQVFTSTWFSLGLIVLVVSIVICTLDRTPRLWRQAAFIRVRQPDAYFDPGLPDRISIAPGQGLTGETVAKVLRRRHFAVRTETDPASGTTWVYGDRHRWTKLATLVSHLGLILFLIAGLVTARLGDEQGLVVADGNTLSVQPIGTPGLLLVQNLGFSAPGLDTGAATDYTTDLAVYKDGVLQARKVIRVNDPLEVDGYTFHQNGFGPAPDVVIRDGAGGVLWSGPVPLTDAIQGLPYAAVPVPGQDVGLQMILSRDDAGLATLLLLPYAVTGTNADGSPAYVTGFPAAVGQGGSTTIQGLGISIAFSGVKSYTLLIAKKDPGAYLVWLAFAALIGGLAITFYLPRRRVWTRLSADGRLDLVGRADRQADFDRELGAIVDALIAARGLGPAAARAAPLGARPGA